MNVNEKIKQLLTERRLTMSELASYCGVSPQAVKQWVDADGTSPRGKRLKKIAEFFKISEIELVYGNEIPSPTASTQFVVQENIATYGKNENLSTHAWTIQEEADHLKARFVGVNRAEFARKFKIKGGDAYLYQHIAGRRPLNLDAALAYANGFGVSLEEISPRLSEEVAQANKHISHSEAPYYREIEEVIKLMEQTDDRGRVKALLAVEDTLAVHAAVSLQASAAALGLPLDETLLRIIHDYNHATPSGKEFITNAAVAASKEENNAHHQKAG